MRKIIKSIYRGIFFVFGLEGAFLLQEVQTKFGYFIVFIFSTIAFAIFLYEGEEE